MLPELSTFTSGSENDSAFTLFAFSLVIPSDRILFNFFIISGLIFESAFNVLGVVEGFCSAMISPSEIKVATIKEKRKHLTQIIQPATILLGIDLLLTSPFSFHEMWIYSIH
jgi:hypothetical protein